MTRNKRRAESVEAPALPDEKLAARFVPDVNEHGCTAAQALVQDIDLQGWEADDVCFDQVVLRRVQLQQAQLSLLQLLDVRFDACDLANARWNKPHIQRVELLSCRLIGLQFIEGHCDNLLMQRCNAEAARFWNTSFRAARFENCSFKAASFDGSDLSGVVFRFCDLREADLRHTKLKGTDVRGCELGGVQVGIADLKGLIVSPAQAVELAGLFGVVVQPEQS